MSNTTAKKQTNKQKLTKKGKQRKINPSHSMSGFYKHKSNVCASVV